ncbi:MAG TPA: HypC/HybG/HupF family hydrogenase formation chaperone [Gemmatimonas sp.]|uniref:HypC/HybG/HupF family hydrogenase formation chaperone n=1 Tax=Gemmatimonas sp. TaxID=1962908 RepID=UPI002ED8F7A7
MCLAVPGRITSIYDEGAMRMAKLDFGGITKNVCLAYLPDAVVGQYAIVHVGFAISLIDEASAQETLHHFRSLGILEEELGEVADEDYAPPPPCPVPSQATSLS